MHITKIPKKNGKFRTIYVPSKEEKRELRKLLRSINKKQIKYLDKEVVHGFFPKRNPVTNAKRHIGYEYTLCFDLHDFFDSVTLDKVGFRLTDKQREKCFVDGAARQGLPTSPALANLAAWPMDKGILYYMKMKDMRGKDIVYTRYADDLSFSFNDPSLIKKLRKDIPDIVKKHGFEINHSKTRCQAAVAGRRIICGVAVDKDSIYPTRKSRRKLRAALHQNHMRSAQGLKEWTKLKVPVVFDAAEQISKVANNLDAYNVDMDFSLDKQPQQATSI